jgi:prevent-host-death family protein
VRRALAHEPQLVTREGQEAVVVVAKEDYERLVAPDNLLDFLRNSPLGEAVRAGEIPEDAFDRRRDLARDIEL